MIGLSAFSTAVDSGDYVGIVGGSDCSQIKPETLDQTNDKALLFSFAPTRARLHSDHKVNAQELGRWWSCRSAAAETGANGNT